MRVPPFNRSADNLHKAAKMGMRAKGKRPLPRGAQRWFVQQARSAIVGVRKDANLYHAIREGEVEPLVDLFREEDPNDYMVWEADGPDEFRAGAYGGKWTIDWAVFSDALKRFEDALRSEMTLDQWLAADLSGMLEDGTRGGSRLLDASTRLKLAQQARRRNLGR